MASFTLTSLTFPEGTTVGAYPASQFPAAGRPPSGAPPGSSEEDQAVASGAASFVALTADTDYYFGADVGGTWRYVAGSTRNVGSWASYSALQDEINNRSNADALLATQTSLTAETAARVAGDTTITANTQTGDYTLVLGDAGKTVEINSASAQVVTVPANASVAFPTGTVIEVSRYGAGTVTLAGAVGVTIRSRGGLLAIGNQYASGSLRKRATNEWVLVGDLA